MALVGFCGSRDLPPHQRKLVSSVVYAVARAERGVAVGCAQGADAMALRECFTPTWALRASMVRVFAAFGPNGQGDGKWSATPLVQKISRLPMAMAGGNGGLRVVVNWWAGGDSSVDLITRLKARSDAMVSAVAASGEGQGLVAFVTARAYPWSSSAADARCAASHHWAKATGRQQDRGSGAGAGDGKKKSSALVPHFEKASSTSWDGRKPGHTRSG